jgi:hypothetical protein
MTWERSGEENNDILFICDFPNCKFTVPMWNDSEKGWCTADPLERIVLVNDSPTKMPPGWKSDGMNHYCFRHDITFKSAIIVEDKWIS